MKRIDWDSLADRYRDAAFEAETVSAFAGVIGEMLAELKDIHVWIELPSGKKLYPFSSRYQANYNYEAVAAKLEAVQRFGRIGFTGRTDDGFGVVVVSALPAHGDKLYERLIGSTIALFDAPGLIVDLRSNGGGSETRAAQIAGLFAGETYIYARSKFRSGPDVNGFREAPPRRIEPTVEEPFSKPVICLVGPGCVSSGEGFALMMKAMPHATLVGQPTRGASGNPHAVTLSNGVKVWYSRWVSMEPDGRVMEGRGIEPDVRVDHVGKGDPTFETAVEMLRERREEIGK